MDYDYDNECIFGFEADGDIDGDDCLDRDQYSIFGCSNADISEMKLSPMQINVELIGDAQWRKHKRRTKSKSKAKPTEKMVPSPATKPAPVLHQPLPLPSLYTESPASNSLSTNSLSLNGQHFQEHAQPQILPPPVSENDYFDAKGSDGRLRLCSSDGYARPHLSKLDTVMREEGENGLCYAAFGSRVASQSGGGAVWRLILHGRSSMVLGFVGALGLGGQTQQRGVDHFVDCGAEAMCDIFGDDARDGHGRVMSVRYDAKDGTLTLRNINTESPRRGRERMAVRGVDVTKAYRLCVLLRAPATITMF